MGIRHITYKSCVTGLLFTLAASPAFAATPAHPPIEPLVIEAKYNVAWNGITIGRIRFSAHENATSYSLTVDTKTHGIGSVFSSEKRVAEAHGLVSNGHYVPGSYASSPQGDSNGRTTRLTYNENGQLTERSRVPDDDVDWRPPVPREQANLATDPVTAGMILRRKLYAALDSDKTEVGVKTYDGARFAEMHFIVRRPDARVNILDRYIDAVTTVVSRQPIAGYTPKELKAFKKGDPTIHLYFSDDARFIPVRATVSTLFGELSATLDEEK